MGALSAAAAAAGAAAAGGGVCGDGSGAVVVDREELESGVRAMLAALGEDTAREGLADTPKRVAKAMAFAVRGYGMSAVHHVGRAAPGMPPQQ